MSLCVDIERIFRGFHLNVAFAQKDEILGLLGASGSGKSMTLKCIAGIETPNRGKIVLNGRTLFDSTAKINLKPQERRVGYLFQSYALFPNMTVADNIGCALTGNPDKEEIIAKMIDRFQLSGLEKRYPAQISGGQQQRVALARSLAYEPEMLLLDEPFSALDAYLKEQLQEEFLELLADYSGDVIMVTHSRDEVYRICEQVMIVENGSIIMSGATKEIFNNPQTLSAAKITGCKNFSRALQVDKNRVKAVDWDLILTVSEPIPADLSHIGIRAHDFKPAANENGLNCFAIDILNQTESPFEINIIFSTNKDHSQRQRIWWQYSKENAPQQPYPYLSIAPEKILLLSSADKSQVDSDN